MAAATIDSHGLSSLTPIRTRVAETDIQSLKVRTVQKGAVFGAVAAVVAVALLAAFGSSGPDINGGPSQP